MMLISRRLPRWKVPLGFNVIASDIHPPILNRMFRSIEPIADQIVVVVDDKAQQELYGISRQYTDDLFYYPWEDNFALARNRALAQTHTPYVAWIDSDEWISTQHAARIHNLMTKPRGLAYYVWQVSPTDSGNTIYVPQIRIFPRSPAVKWEIPIHEQILPSLQRAGVKTQLTDLRLEHAGYLNPATVYRKHRRNLKILRREVRRNPEDSFTRSNYDKAIGYERWLRQGGNR